MQNQDFRGEHCFFDLSGSENFNISEFHGGKICHVFVDVHLEKTRMGGESGHILWDDDKC